MCNIRRFYLLRELYEVDFHKPRSMEAGEYELTRGTCFVARRLEVVTVAGLLWISSCVLGGADFFVSFLFLFCFFFFERTRPAASIRPPCLIYLYTIIVIMPLCPET